MTPAEFQKEIERIQGEIAIATVEIEKGAAARERVEVLKKQLHGLGP